VCCGVVVGGESEKGVGWVRREVVLHGVLVDTEKMKTKKHTFFVSFLLVVGTVFDSCGISRPPRCCTGHPFSWGVCLWLFFSEFKVGGGRDLL
jgi:hypothetical protein